MANRRQQWPGWVWFLIILAIGMYLLVAFDLFGRYR